MKKLILIFTILSFALISCNNNEKSEKKEISTDLIHSESTAAETEGKINQEEAPRFDFDKEVQEFGEISQGEIVKKEYHFKNVGQSNLIISNAVGSCGCTVPVFPKQPIKPGEKGVIEVVFNSNGKRGHVHNTITLIANTIPNKTILALKGDVLIPNNN